MPVNPNILIPVTDAIIETSWGIDMSDTLNWVYDNKMNLAGGTFTGPVYSGVGWSTSEYALMPKSYIDWLGNQKVNRTGDTMTGTLWINPTDAYALRLRSAAATESITMDFFNSATTVQWGYLNMQANQMTLNQNSLGHFQLTAAKAQVYSSSGGISLHASSGQIDISAPGAHGTRFLFDGTVYGQAGGAGSGAQFMWGKTASNIATNGVELGPFGRVDVKTTTGVPLYLRRDPSPGAAYVQFAINDGPGSIAADIRCAPASGVQFVNCVAVPPSDYRLKDDLGPIVNAIDQVLELQPKRLAWKTTGDAFDGFIAHEADPVVPYLVHGEKDALDENGGVEGQGFDYGGLTALLTAAVQELVGRVAALEGAG